jgi:hypothetical protein
MAIFFMYIFDDVKVNHDSEATLMPTLCYFIILLSFVAW